MLSLEVPWPAALCWAVAPSTSSTPLGHPHPSSAYPVPGPTVLRDIPGFPLGQEGQEHPMWKRGGGRHRAEPGGLAPA